MVVFVVGYRRSILRSQAKIVSHNASISLVTGLIEITTGKSPIIIFIVEYKLYF